MIELSHRLAEIACKVVRKRRLHLDLSQDNLAQRTGLARSYISDVERGSRHPTLHNLTLISQALEWSPSQLVRETEIQAVNLLDPARMSAAQRGETTLTALEQEVLHYIETRMSEAILIVDASGKLVLFNKPATRILGTIQDAGVEHWAETYGCYKPDRVTPVAPQEFALVRALEGKDANLTLFLRNQSLREGAFFHSSGRRLLDPETGTLRGAFTMLQSAKQ